MAEQYIYKSMNSDNNNNQNGIKKNYLDDLKSKNLDN